MSSKCIVVAMTTTTIFVVFIRSYYSVLVGWCGFYFIHSCATPLPPNISVSNTTWNDLQVTQ